MHGEKCSEARKLRNITSGCRSSGDRKSNYGVPTMTRRAANLTNLTLSLFLAAGLLCSGAQASAQAFESVTIPFAFSANHHSVPAGSYKVQLLSDRFLSFHNIKTDKTQIMLVRPEEGPVIETQGRLIFRRDGGRNYLTQVWIAGTNVHSELAVPLKRERAFTKGVVPQNLSFEVALK